jgi:serine/threonine protein phosphatase PrpC
MKYTTHTHTGQRKSQNEDSVALAVFEDNHLDTDREAGVFVLSDGAGGEERGEIASYIATTEVMRVLSQELFPLIASNPHDVGIDIPDSFSGTGENGEDDSPEPLAPKKPEGHEIKKGLKNAVSSAHKRILEYASEASIESGAYATVVAGVYADGVLHYAWVGDSRLYSLNTEKDSLDLLTRDHSKVQRLEDKNRVNEVEAKVHPEGHSITRALGGSSSTDIESDVEVDTNRVEVFDSDIIFFTSDGIIDAYPHIHGVRDEDTSLFQMYQGAGDREKEVVANMIWDTVVSEQEIRDIILDLVSNDKPGEDELERAGETLLTLGNRHGGKDNMSFIFFSSETADSAPDELPERGPDSGISIEKPDENMDADQTKIKGGEKDSSPMEETSPKDNSDESEEDSNLILSDTDSDERHEIKPGDIIGSGSDADITLSHDGIDDAHIRMKFSGDGKWIVKDLQTDGGTSILNPEDGETVVRLGTKTGLLENEISEGEAISFSLEGEGRVYTVLSGESDR